VKKFREFLHRVPIKLYILIFGVLLLSFFSNDFGLVDIQKTAIILAAGLDRTETGVHLTAQIATPKGSERSSCGTASVDIEGDGETVSDCIAEIYSKTGWVPKLIFCNLILLGEDTLKEDVFDVLDFFLRNEYMQDSCLIAACEGTARDMLTSVSAIEDTSSLALEKLFSDAAVKSGRVMKNSLKEFAIGYHGISQSGYMPFIRSQDQDCGSESGGGSGSSSSGSGGGQQSGSSAQGEEQKKIYFAEETVIFSRGKMSALLNREQTFAFSLLKSKVFAGTFGAEENGKPLTLSILKDEGGVSLDMKNKPKAKFSINLKVRLYNRGVPSPIEDVADSKVPDKAIQNAKEKLEKDMRELWTICRDNDCDLFQLKRSLYRSSLKKYGEWKDLLLSTAEAEFAPNIESIR